MIKIVYGSEGIRIDVGEISKYSKVQLEKLAKQNGITLRKRDGNPRTKEQLFRSLKRKKLI